MTDLDKDRWQFLDNGFREVLDTLAGQIQWNYTLNLDIDRWQARNNWIDRQIHTRGTVETLLESWLVGDDFPPDADPEALYYVGVRFYTSRLLLHYLIYRKDDLILALVPYPFDDENHHSEVARSILIDWYLLRGAQLAFDQIYEQKMFQGFPE